jgi:hypothetical protein
MIVDGVATKSDLQLLRQELKQDLVALKQDLMVLENRLTLRMGIMLMASTTIIIALMSWITHH